VGAALEFGSPLRPEFLLFHEGPSRVLISTERAGDVLRIAAEYGVEAIEAGSTVQGRVAVRNHGETLIDLNIAPLCKAWREALEARLRG
jgi:phosphoribosylformylglycinamidine synthase